MDTNFVEAAIAAYKRSVATEEARLRLEQKKMEAIIAQVFTRIFCCPLPPDHVWVDGRLGVRFYRLTTANKSQCLDIVPDSNLVTASMEDSPLEHVSVYPSFFCEKHGFFRGRASTSIFGLGEQFANPPACLNCRTNEGV